MNVQVCHCGWTKCTTYHGLRVHQGKKGCTPKGMRIPKSEQFRFSQKVNYLGPQIRVQEPFVDVFKRSVDSVFETPRRSQQTTVSWFNDSRARRVLDFSIHGQQQLERERQQQLERERQQQLERERQQQLEREREQQLEREWQQQLERERQQQLEREWEREWQQQLERGRQQQLERERQQQLERERERKRQQQLERERQQQLERERQQQLERERQQQLERERQQQLEREQQQQLERERERERQQQLERERQQQLERERQQQLERERQKQLERERQQQLEREREQQLERERQQQLERERQQQLEREREQQLEREWQQQLERERQQQLEREWEREWQQQLEREREREWQQQLERERQQQLERERQQQLEREQQQQLERERERERQQQLERERERERQQQLEKERQREKAQKLQKARQEKMKADILQKIDIRQHKMAEVRSSVIDCKGSLDAEWREINNFFSDVIKVVEDARQKALQPLEDRRWKVKRDEQDVIAKLQREIDVLKKAIHESDKNPDLDVSPLTGLSDSTDCKNLCVDTSLSFGTLRAATSAMMKQIQQEIEKLSSIELKRISPFAVDVKLDPATAHQSLVLSDDGKKVRDVGKTAKGPDSPQRFDMFGSVLGFNRLTSGKSYWEVEVSHKTGWDLGVARRDANRKGILSLNPDNGYWAVVHYEDKKYSALTAPPVSLSLKEKPQKVGVFVDYEEGLVSFYDVTSQSHIFSFTECLFGGEILPYFSPHLKQNEKNTDPLIISAVLKHS